ncbi:MAG: hypothetical protein P8X53_00445 [Chromatiales bacterium]|jgi:hypothetical protein
MPGQNPKPPPAVHAPQLWRCLVEGCRRADPELARQLEREPDIFSLLSWNSFFYSESEDIGPDLPWIDLVLERSAPDPRDIRDARSWNKRFLRLLYGIADRMPWLVDLIPDPHMKNTLQQANRYFENHNHLAEQARALVIDAVSEAWRDQVPICVIGHSLGSVIAFDALWELDHIEHSRAQVDLFLTFGSPLGSNYVRKRLLGAAYRHERRFPGNIRSWVNLPAVGDHISLDKDFEEYFAEMLDVGETREILQPAGPLYNLYRDENGLNPHRSYGYLCHREVGAAVQSWWLRGERQKD